MPPYLVAMLAQFLTSGFRRKLLYARAELRRRIKGTPRELVYFHQVSDPYSHLMVQVLPGLAERFDLTLRPFVIGDIHPDMVPEPEMLNAYGPRDAAALAGLYGLEFPVARRASPQKAAALGAHLVRVANETPEEFCAEAIAAGEAYWMDQPWPSEAPESGWSAKGEQELAKRGHYLPGTVWYGGEWYWGLDRLDHLETRLADRGLGLGPARFDKTYDGIFDPLDAKPATPPPPLEMFFSARSPYSYIGLFQARRFVDAMGLELILRPVLPMVMRNMKVPFAKRLYIVTDAKREATKAGMPFGRIADPLGAGVERTYAVAYWVQQTDPERLEAFFRSAMQGIFAEAVDVATDKGLRQVVERAGLDWAEARLALEGDGWKDWVQDNRDAMTELGLWGVPSFRMGGVAIWGQDRFWRLRQGLGNVPGQ